MNQEKKTFNLIIGIALVLVGILFVLCGKFADLIDYLLGGACCVGAIALGAKTIVTKKKVLVGPVIIAGIILAAGITLFAYPGAIGSTIQTIINIALITVGAIILVDTIIHFVKKRSTAINIVELFIAAALITVGVVALCVSGIDGLVFYFSGAVIIFAGIIVIIASLIDFKKYQKAQNQPVSTKAAYNNNSNKKKHRK